MTHSIRHSLGIEPGEHPAYEDLAKVIDGTADDVTREIVESHAAACSTCDAELRDLRSFTGTPSWPELLRWLGAAAAMIAVFIAGWYLLRRRPVERTDKPPVRERSVSASRPAKLPAVARDYGREEWEAAVRAALERGAIDPPKIVGELRASPDMLRGPAAPPRSSAMRPAGMVIDSPAPMLHWRAAPGRYVVSVYDGVRRVARSAPLRATQWRVSPPLARGRTYTWQVEIVRGSSTELLAPPPAPPALLHVLDAKTSAELLDAQRLCPDDHLLHGVLFARAGLQEKAVEELRLANENALAESVARW